MKEGIRFHKALLVPILMVSVFLFFPERATAKKIKSSFKIEKNCEKKIEKPGTTGTKILLGSTLTPDSILKELKRISFSGYEKEASSSKESFLITNPTRNTIIGFTIRIDYLDMQGRMLHSREVDESCFVPSKESRKIDIPSWDKQHTYYYYLGNAPRRVATPYKVAVHPVAFLIEESSF